MIGTLIAGSILVLVLMGLISYLNAKASENKDIDHEYSDRLQKMIENENDSRNP